MKSRIIAGVTGFICLLTLVASASVSAQQTSSTSGQNQQATANSMKVTPVRKDLELDPGGSTQVEVSAQNLTAQTVQLKAVLSDFEASKDESGQPLVILDDSYAKSHSLKRLATIEPATLTLQPNQIGVVKVTITAPKSARAGGYYGTVRFAPVNDVTPSGNGVALSANVGSLVLLRINGDIKEKMTLESMDVRQNNKPSTFFKTNKNLVVVTRFNNQGNVQVQPFGKFQVLDRNGKVVEEHEVNNTDPRGNVLPESIRRFDTKLTKIGTFGKYTLQGNFGYGTKGELLTYKQTFWVVPTSYIIMGIAGLLVIALIVFLIVKVALLSKRGGGRGHGRRY